MPNKKSSFIPSEQFLIHISLFSAKKCHDVRILFKYIDTIFTHYYSPPTWLPQRRERCQRVRDILQSPAPSRPLSSQRVSSQPLVAPSILPSSKISEKSQRKCEIISKGSHSLRLRSGDTSRPSSSAIHRLRILLHQQYCTNIAPIMHQYCQPLSLMVISSLRIITKQNGHQYGGHPEGTNIWFYKIFSMILWCLDLDPEKAAAGSCQQVIKSSCLQPPG